MLNVCSSCNVNLKSKPQRIREFEYFLMFYTRDIPYITRKRYELLTGMEYLKLAQILEKDNK